MSPNEPAQARPATGLRLQTGAPTGRCLQPDSWAFSSPSLHEANAGQRVKHLAHGNRIRPGTGDVHHIQAIETMSRHEIKTVRCSIGIVNGQGAETNAEMNGAAIPGLPHFLYNLSAKAWVLDFVPLRHRELDKGHGRVFQDEPAAEKGRAGEGNNPHYYQNYQDRRDDECPAHSD